MRQVERSGGQLPGEFASAPSRWLRRFLLIGALASAGIGALVIGPDRAAADEPDESIETSETGETGETVETSGTIEIVDIGEAPAPVDDATLLGGADLAITLTPSTPGPFVDQSFTWTVQVTNNGPDPAASITVTDLVPGAVAVMSVSSDSFDCAAPASTVSCTKPDLAPGASGSITIQVMVPNSLTPQVLTNVADVAASTLDPNPLNNNAASAVLTVVVIVGGPVVPTSTPASTPATTADGTAPAISSAATISTDVAVTSAASQPLAPSTTVVEVAAAPDFTDTLPETGPSVQLLLLLGAPTLVAGLALGRLARRPLSTRRVSRG